MSAALEGPCPAVDNADGSWLRVAVYRVDTQTGERALVTETVVVGAAGVATAPFSERWPPCTCPQCQPA